MPTTPETPLMVDAALVEIKRHLRRCVDVAMTLDTRENSEHSAIAKAVDAAYRLTDDAIIRHRAAYDLGVPNH